MPCKDWGSHTERALTKETRNVEAKLHTRTAQACLAMQLLLEYAPDWIPLTSAEKALVKWFEAHRVQDRKFNKLDSK